MRCADRTARRGREVRQQRAGSAARVQRGPRSRLGPSRGTLRGGGLAREDYARMNMMPMIGMSPRILRQVPRELGFRGKTLQYLEQSMAHCLMRLGARVAMIPTIESSSDVARWQVDVEDYCAGFDGLLLQG